MLIKHTYLDKIHLGGKQSMLIKHTLIRFIKVVNMVNNKC